MQFLENRSYGYNIILKKYAKFPLWLPLPCQFEHGWSVRDDPLKSDLATDKPMMLVFNRRRKIAWEKLSQIPVYIIGSPFVLYRRAMGITKKKGAEGTVVFPSHSTYFTKSKFDIEKYCRELEKLPPKFQPITICLFWLDYIDKTADVYRRHGFKVVTAGVKIANSLSFVRNFYEILSSHHFATSNDIGSYTLYAIDLGLPFFLTGNTPVVINAGGKDPNISTRDCLTDHHIGRTATGLFSTGPTETISPSQKKFIHEESGMQDCLKPEQLNKLFWQHAREKRYCLTAMVPYLVLSFFIFLIFNGPWIGFLTKIRKKMAQ